MAMAGISVPRTGSRRAVRVPMARVEFSHGKPKWALEHLASSSAYYHAVMAYAGYHWRQAPTQRAECKGVERDTPLVLPFFFCASSVLKYLDG
jgi:hypothetical protein